MQQRSRSSRQDQSSSNERPPGLGRRNSSHRRTGGGEREPEPASSREQELVVYDPDNTADNAAAPRDREPMNRQRKKVSDREPKSSQSQSQQQQQQSQPQKRAAAPASQTSSSQRQPSSTEPAAPKIRAGDVRKLYKVLPIIIGTGSFGTVRSCIHRPSKTKLAIKSISFKGQNGLNSTLVKNEIALHQRVNHRNVVKVVDVIRDREYIHIIMEQCRGGDLFDKTIEGSNEGGGGSGGSRLSEGKIRKIVGCLLDAVGYLHDRNIVHRDLKAEHLMFASSDPKSPIKIIDFGVACHHAPTSPPMTAFAGSLRSMAPEVIKRSYGRECDMWSVGVITYFLLTQQMPFDSQLASNELYQKDVFQKICGGKFYYPQWAAKGLSEEAKSFIDGLLVVDPKRRMSAKQAMGHAWIRGGKSGRSSVVKQAVKEAKPRNPTKKAQSKTFHAPESSRPKLMTRKSKSRHG